MGIMPLQSKLNPFAPAFRLSTLTTATHQPPPQNHHLYYYYHFFLPYNIHNPPAAVATTTTTPFLPSPSYYYVTTSTSPDISLSCPPSSSPPPPLTTDQTSLPSPSYYYVTASASQDITPSCPPPSYPPPPVTTDQTSEQHTRLDTTAGTRGSYRRRRGGRRGGFVPRRVRQQWRAAQATVSTVKGNGGGSSGCDRGTRRVRGIVRDRKEEVLKLKPDDSSTTVMIKNIPSRYTRELLMEFLDKHCMTMNDEAGSDSTEKFISAYDFLYLPMDFEKKASKGYAFVNFTDPKAAWRFFETSDRQSWDRFHSSKIRQIVSARLQGKERLVKHFGSSAFRCESDDYLPVCFSPARDGSEGREVEQTTVGNRVW